MCILIISMSIGYYYAIFLPRLEQVKNDQQTKLTQEELRSKTKSKLDLEICLATADDNYQANFESYCISEGRGANCTAIRAVNEARVSAIEKGEKSDCFRKYPQS